MGRAGSTGAPRIRSELERQTTFARTGSGRHVSRLGLVAFMIVLALVPLIRLTWFSGPRSDRGRMHNQPIADW